MADQGNDWFTRNREDPLSPPDRGDATPTAEEVWAPENEAWLATHVTARATELPEQPPMLGPANIPPGDYTRVQPGPPQNYGQPPRQGASEEQYEATQHGGTPHGAPRADTPYGQQAPPRPAPPTRQRTREDPPISHPSAAYPPASHPSAAYPPASNTADQPPAPPQRQAPLTPPPGYHDAPEHAAPEHAAPEPQPFGQQQQFSGQQFPPEQGFGPPPYVADHQQPVSYGSAPPPSGPGDPATSAPTKPTPDRRKIGWIITAAVLALALVVFLALRYGGKEAEPPPPPSSTVRTYLEAISHSDAMAARAQLTEVPADDVLLNQQTLAASQQEAPLQVTSVTDGTGGQVTASYTLAGEPMTTLFNTARQPDGSHRVDGLVSVDLPAFGKLPLQVNGTDMAGRDKVRAFPGRYQLTTGLPFIGYDKPELTVSGPDRGAQTAATPVITPKGVEALRSAARSKLDGCLRSHDLAPTGCALGADAGDSPLVPGSVTWKVSNTPFAEAQPRLGYGNPTKVKFDTSFASRVEVRYQSSPDEVTGTDQNFEVRVTADLGGTDTPRDLKFERR